jgi:hypothetical protein
MEKITKVFVFKHDDAAFKGLVEFPKKFYGLGIHDDFEVVADNGWNRPAFKVTGERTFLNGLAALCESYFGEDYCVVLD